MHRIGRVSFPQSSIPGIKELQVELTADERITCIGLQAFLVLVVTQVLCHLLAESLGCSGVEGFRAPLARSLCRKRNRGVHQRIA